MSINRNDVELKTQAHQMQAEGLQDDQPTIPEIIKFIRNEGYEVLTIDIEFDKLMHLWSLLAEIKESK